MLTERHTDTNIDTQANLIIKDTILRFIKYNRILKHTYSTSLGCTRPELYCTHSGAVFSMKDCDGDGIADPTCKDSSGDFGVLQSSKGCADSWPRGTCNPEGNLFHFFYISKKFVIFHHFVYSIQLVQK